MPAKTIVKQALGLFIGTLLIATLFVIGARVRVAYGAPEATVSRAQYRMAVGGQVARHRRDVRTIRRLRRELHRKSTHIRRLGVANRQNGYLNGNVRGAIRYVFGPEAQHAMTVSSCESGGNLDNVPRWLRAGNGQYQGGFQMGSSERAAYANGHYTTVLDQVLAAYRLFMERGWHPWQCRETGGLRW